MSECKPRSYPSASLPTAKANSAPNKGLSSKSLSQASTVSLAGDVKRTEANQATADADAVKNSAESSVTGGDNAALATTAFEHDTIRNKSWLTITQFKKTMASQYPQKKLIFTTTSQNMMTKTKKPMFLLTMSDHLGNEISTHQGVVSQGKFGKFESVGVKPHFKHPVYPLTNNPMSLVDLSEFMI